MTPERMKEKQLPDKLFGRNDLHNIDVTDEEYKNNHEFWKEYQCETIYDSSIRQLILTHLSPGLGLSDPYKVKLFVRILMENN